MRVLLANDSSPHSRAAAEYLLALPFRKPIDLDVACAVTPPMMVDTGLGIPVDLKDFIDAERHAVQARVEETAKHLSGPVHSVHTHVTVGPPSSELLNLADTIDADLVVLGAVGHSGMQRVLLGSVSDYVATHSDVSTLIVRPLNDSEIPPTLQKIMIALSGQPQDERMLQWLRCLKWNPGIEIHLVRILRLDSFYRQDIRKKASTYWDAFMKAAQAQILSFETTLQTMGLNTETHLVEADHVGEALIIYAEQHGCDLMMTGDSDSGLLTRIFLGSTSRYVLRHAQCSVLIVRDKVDRAAAKCQLAEQQKPHPAPV